MGDFIQLWAQAIATFEGFTSGGASRPSRNHNPGDLKYAGQTGAIGQDAQGFAIFPDDATGFQALYNQLAKYVAQFPGYSIVQITAHYLGMGSTPTVNQEGNAFTYANFVASALGVTTDTTLGDLATAAIAVASDVGNSSSGGGGDSGSSSGFTPTGGDLVVILIGGGIAFWLLSRILGW